MLDYLLTAFPQLAILIDTTGIVLDINQWTIKFIGLRKNNIIGKKLIEILDIANCKFKKILESKEIFFDTCSCVQIGNQTEFLYYVLPDVLNWNRVLILGINLASFLPTGTVGFNRSIKMLFDEFSHAGVGLMLVDKEGELVYANNLVMKYLGFTKEQSELVVMGRPPLVLKALEQKQVIREICEYIIDDEKMYVDVTAIPLLRDGEVIGGISLGTDETERILLEKKLIDSERMFLIGEMAARIMHDVRNPLQIIKSSVQMINIWKERGNLDSERIDALLNNIDVAVNNVLDLMNDILQFSKPEKVKMVNISIPDLMEHMVELLKSSFDKFEIGFQMQLCDCQKIVGDSKLIRQAFLNIIQNAMEVLQKFSGIRRFEIRSYKNADNVIFELFNTGPLIPEEIQDKIFETFFTTKGTSGTGLGLTITKEIIEKIHGGRLWCVSSIENEGTSFFIELPLYQDREYELVNVMDGKL